MKTVYYIPGLFLTALCHVIITYFLSERKWSKRKFIWYSVIFIVLFIAVGCCMYAVQGMAALVPYMAISGGLCVFCCASSRDCLPKKGFMFMTYFYFFTVLDNTWKILARLLLPGASALGKYYTAIVLRSAVLLLLVVLYEKYCSETLRSISDMGNKGKRWWNLAVIALLFYLIQLSVSIRSSMDNVGQVFVLALFVAMSVIMFAVYSVIFSNIKYMKRDAEVALIRQNAEYLSAQLSVLQSAAEKHRRTRHDMRHHLEAIAGYAKEGDTAEILAYIREYNSEISETALKQYSVNRTINSILSAYGEKAEEREIDFSVSCNAPETLSVRDIDLIAVLGNLLENALHGCEESGKRKRFISVHIRMRNSSLITVCENVCRDDLRLSGGLPSGKSVGISSILTACMKYDGNLDYHIENGVCSACAVLNV